MNAPRVLYQMVRADFLERVRRYSFLVTLAAALFLAYAVAAEKIWIVVGNGYRGVYNSAWIGMLMTVCCSTFLSLVGFYIVKNSVQRDTDTRVGQILAATPMRKDFYTVAKTLSNFAVLACMVVVLMLAAVVMQLFRAEAHSFSLWKLWAPFVFFAMPTMLLAGSVALLFETLPVLRGGVGNVAYFFLWTAALAMGVTGVDDPSGLQLLYRSTRNALRAVDPANPDNFHFSLTIGGEHAVRTFPWNGIEWSTHVLLMRSAVDQPRRRDRAVGLCILSSLRSCANLAQAAGAGRTQRPRSIARGTRAHSFASTNYSGASHSAYSFFRELALSAVSRFRASLDAKRPALVVVRRRSRITRWPIRLSRTKRAQRIPAGRMDMAHPRLVSNGMPRSSPCHERVALLFRTQPFAPASRRLGRGRSCRRAHRKRRSHSASTRRRLAQLRSVARRSVVHPQLRPRARRLERWAKNIRSDLHSVVVRRSGSSTART